MNYKRLHKLFFNLLTGLMAAFLLSGGTLINGFALNSSSDDVGEYISNMTIEEKIGQLFVLRFPPIIYIGPVNL